VTLWISPALPSPLRAPLQALASSGDTWVQIVEDGSTAQVRAEAMPEVSLATWIYAVVAPFPTVLDSVPYSDLQSLWGEEGRVLAEGATAAAIGTLLGERASDESVQSTAQRLIDRAWQERTAFAIIPFEDLEPRWKVVGVDGLSPIANDFAAEAYPLAIPFGLSGDPTAVAWVQHLLASSPLPEASWPTTNRDPSRLTVVLMTGVTALARATSAMMVSNGVDYPAELIRDWMRGADVTHVSHEVSFATNCPEPDPFSRNLRMCGQPDQVALLVSSGVDVVELTGNHLLDWGVPAFLFTLDLYQSNGLATYAGGADLTSALRPLLIEHNGNRLAFLGCNQPGPDWVWATDEHPGAAPCSDPRVLMAVRELRDQGVLPIFTYQWSEGYRVLPYPGQIEDFRAAIDAGAVIVSGSQAHTPQTFEFYGDGLIHYGLGNLFFDQMWSTATRQEFLDRHVFYDGRFIGSEILTAMLENYAQPRPMTPEERRVFLESVFAASGW
jgi:poly-gamma-glutamate synthesis protein (capsule biosynthesis protein)